MRIVISFVSAALVATLTGTAAVAESRSLGKQTVGQVMLACIKGGGQYTESSGGFGCKTAKGEVTCQKTGTLNQGAVGNCTGCNPSCGQSAKAGGKPSGRTMGSILAGSSVEKTQPLTAQKTIGTPKLDSKLDSKFDSKFDSKTASSQSTNGSSPRRNNR